MLLICDAEGLIGRDMFAIDGCKLPGNASKEWSGTRAELKKKKRKLNKAARYILNKHRTSDQQEQDHDIQEREAQQRKKLRCASRKIQLFLDSHEKRTGASGKPVKSNIATSGTDWQCATGRTGTGVLSPTGRVSHGGLTQTNGSPEYPGRFKRDSLIEQMKRRIDSEQRRHTYSQRLGTVEPVFGHITHAMVV